MARVSIRGYAQNISLESRRVSLAIASAMEAEGQKIVDLLDGAVKTWNHKPDFGFEITAPGGDLVMVVGTDDEIFGYVEQGTQPHPIYPVRAKMLRFQTGYRAKSVPNIVGSFSGGPSGAIVFRKRVMHPGSKPRNFIPTIFNKRRYIYVQNMQLAIAKATKG